jgi:hypothetical protein
VQAAGPKADPKSFRVPLDGEEEADYCAEDREREVHWVRLPPSSRLNALKLSGEVTLSRARQRGQLPIAAACLAL